MSILKSSTTPQKILSTSEASNCFVKIKKINDLALKIYKATDVEGLSSILFDSGAKTTSISDIKNFCTLVLNSSISISDIRVQQSIRSLANSKISPLKAMEFTIIKEELIEKIVSKNQINSLMEMVGKQVKRALSKSLPPEEQKEILLQRRAFLQSKYQETAKSLHELYTEDDGGDNQYKNVSQNNVLLLREKLSALLSEIQREQRIIDTLLS